MWESGGAVFAAECASETGGLVLHVLTLLDASALDTILTSRLDSVSNTLCPLVDTAGDKWEVGWKVDIVVNKHDILVLLGQGDSDELCHNLRADWYPSVVDSISSANASGVVERILAVAIVDDEDLLWLEDLESVLDGLRKDVGGLVSWNDKCSLSGVSLLDAVNLLFEATEQDWKV